MFTKFLIRSSTMLVVPLMMTGCVFGENKQFFEDATTTASSASPTLPDNTGGSDPVGTQTPAPISTPTATPAPIATPTATPIFIGTPTPTPVSTPAPIATPSPTAAPTATPAPTSAPVATPTPVSTATPRPVSTPTPAPIVTATPSPTPDCTAATTTKNLRIMFMVDNSGSTLDTDPDQNVRVKTVQNFLASYGSHTNLSYSFGFFTDYSAYQYDSSRTKYTSKPKSPFGGANFLASALQRYEDYTPYGWTPYAAAFNELQRIVAQDEASGTAMDYVVVFMSDGQPTDISGNVTTALKNMVNNLRGTVESNHTSLLTVSTVYFGDKSDTTSISNLKTMASQGLGQFVDTNSLKSALEINDVITVPSCH